MSYIYDASDSNGLVKAGDYEATIERIEKKTLPSGKEKLSIMYRIRSDVEQPYKNKCLFEDIWSERDNPNMFNRKRINQLLGTQNPEDGQVFETINDVIDFLTGCNLIIHVAVELDTYHGEDVNTISFYRSSKIKPQTLNESKAEETIKDDDIPF